MGEEKERHTVGVHSLPVDGEIDKVPPAGVATVRSPDGHGQDIGPVTPGSNAQLVDQFLV